MDFLLYSIYKNNKIIINFLYECTHTLALEWVNVLNEVEEIVKARERPYGNKSNCVQRERVSLTRADHKVEIM
jgi:hypothetical protein